jgi:epoxide hydrolase-like predicted phosphatase
MPVINAVIFDVGGVLVRTSNRENRLMWENQLGLEELQSEEIVFNSDVGTKAQMGQIGDKELWSWVGRRLDLNSEQLLRFRRDFWSGDVLDEELIAFIRSLKSRYQTAIISNATLALRQTLTEIYPIESAFDLIVCSAEEKIMKPNLEIYRRTLKKLGIEPRQSIFIDDSEVNIQAAQSLGMSAILYRSGLNIPDALRDFGI